MQIFRFTSSKPSKSAIASDEKFIRLRTNSFVRYCPSDVHRRFSILGLIFKGSLGLNSYGAAFWYFLIFGEGLGLFDLLVIDLLWRCNTKRIRFSFLPKKEAYQNPEKHVGSFLRGIPLFAAIAALTAGIVARL